MTTYTETPLTCSECNRAGTYTYGWHEDEIVCIWAACDKTLNISDLELEPGELVRFNEQNVLCVFTPQ